MAQVGTNPENTAQVENAEPENRCRAERFPVSGTEFERRHSACNHTESWRSHDVSCGSHVCRHTHMRTIAMSVPPYKTEGDAFPSGLLTAVRDAVTIFYPRVYTSRHTMQKPHFKSQASALKIKSTVFSDTEGPLLLDFKSCNDKINANRCCQNLQKAAKQPVYGPNLPHCDLWTAINRTFEGLTSCRATMARVSVVQYLGNSTRNFLQMRYADMCNGTPVSMPVVIFSVAVPSHVDIL